MMRPTPRGGPPPMPAHGATGLPTLSELGQLRSTNTNLRRELEQAKKEATAHKATVEATQNQLRQSELARAACEEYARRLEQRLEKSGKGVALLKAARLQSDLDFLEKENKVLFGDVQSKDKEIQQLQEELQRQHGLVEQASHQLGLPSRKVLEELYDLRQQVAQLIESMGDKDDQLKSQAANLQDFHVYKSDYKRVKDRCEEVEAALKRAEDDKAALLDYIEDLRRHKDQDQAKLDELMASKQGLKKQLTGLEAKRVELEVLIKEQQDVLQASKQQCDILEVQLEKHKRAASELGHERMRLTDQVQALQRQTSLVEVELVGMQEHMRGVLELSRKEQAEMNARVDGLTHRITAALTTASAPGACGDTGGVLVPALSSSGQSQGVVIAVSRASRQQEALIEQHLQLKQELRAVSDVRELNQQLAAKVSSLEAEHHRLQQDKAQLEAQVKEQTFAWSLLEAAVARSGVHGHAPALPGAKRETELVKCVQSELAQARSHVEVMQQRCLDHEREAEQLQRTIANLRESLETTRSAIAELPPAEDFAEALAQSSQLEALKERLEQRLKVQAQMATERQEADAQHLHTLEERVQDLQAKLTAAKGEQLRLEELVERARTLQAEAMREAATAKEVVHDREEELVNLRAKVAAWPSYRPQHLQQREEAHAEELRALGEQLAEARRKLAEARQEQQALQEQLDRARALHGESLREARELQGELQRQLGDARELHGASLREAREAQEELQRQLADARELHARAVQQARDEAEQLQGLAQSARALQAGAERDGEEQRRRLQEALAEARRSHAKAAQEAEAEQRRLQDALAEARRAQLSAAQDGETEQRALRQQVEDAQARLAHAEQEAGEQVHRLETMLQEDRALHARASQEADEELRRLRQLLEGARTLQEEAVREVAEAKQVVQQQEQQIVELRARLAIRRPSRSQPGQPEAGVTMTMQAELLQPWQASAGGRRNVSSWAGPPETGRDQGPYRDTGRGGGGRGGTPQRSHGRALAVGWQEDEERVLETPTESGRGGARMLVDRSVRQAAAGGEAGGGARVPGQNMSSLHREDVLQPQERVLDQGPRSTRGERTGRRAGKGAALYRPSSSSDEEGGAGAGPGRRSLARHRQGAAAAVGATGAGGGGASLLQPAAAPAEGRTSTAKFVQAQLAVLAANYGKLRGSKGAP